MKGATNEREEYVSRVLSLYLGLAETPARSSRLDRRLAEELYENQIGLEEVESAMILASARRLLRSANAPKLGPIRSLHYFLPVIDEVRSVPVSADCIAIPARQTRRIRGATFQDLQSLTGYLQEAVAKKVGGVQIHAVLHGRQHRGISTRQKYGTMKSISLIHLLPTANDM
jgi:hypothetical protein